MPARLLSTDLAPVGGFYLIFMAVLAAGLRLHRRGGTDGARRVPSRLAARLRPGWRAFATQVLGTVAGGYLLLMAVLAGFYFGVDRVTHDFLASALTGCGLLAGIGLAVFGAASWLAERRRRPEPPPVTRAEPPPVTHAEPPPAAG